GCKDNWDRTNRMNAGADFRNLPVEHFPGNALGNVICTDHYPHEVKIVVNGNVRVETREKIGCLVATYARADECRISQSGRDARADTLRIGDPAIPKEQMLPVVQVGDRISD